MAQDLSTEFKAELVSDEQQYKLLRLITITLPDTTVQRIVDCNYSITYDGLLYNKFPVEIGEITQKSDGSVEAASMTVANVSREIELLIRLHNGLRRSNVVITTVYEKFVDLIYTVLPNGSVETEANPSVDTSDAAHTSEEFLVESYQSNETSAVFTLVPVISMVGVLPYRRCLSTCSWVYKDPNTCKYAGARTMCDKTLADCVDHYTSTFDLLTCRVHTEDVNGILVKKITNSDGGYDFTTKSIQPLDSIYIEDTASNAIVSYVFTDHIVVHSSSTNWNPTDTPLAVATVSIIQGTNEKNFGGFPGMVRNRRVTF